MIFHIILCVCSVLLNFSPTELKVTMKNLGQELTEDQLKLMIREADCNGDGVIDFEGNFGIWHCKCVV